MVNKWLLLLNREPPSIQSDYSTQAYFDASVSLMGFIIKTWVRGYLQEHSSSESENSHSTMDGFLDALPQVVSVMRLAVFFTLPYSLVDKNHNSLACVWEIVSHIITPVSSCNNRSDDILCFFLNLCLFPFLFGFQNCNTELMFLLVQDLGHRNYFLKLQIQIMSSVLCFDRYCTL